jgi:uncharacterized Fe-S cluster-containing radical SAM superfamily protein
VIPFDPVQRAALAEQASMRGTARRYYRFRAARYYGGIVTADAIGCSFLCAYCWNYHRNLHPDRYGRFNTPEQVALNLRRIARKTGYHLYRMTGSEPVLGSASLRHVLEVIRTVRASDLGARFVLETNGLELGRRPELAGQIPTEGVMVRVALKGCDEPSFERVTGADPEFFEYTLGAVRLLQDRGIRAWPAVMEDLFEERDIAMLEDRLRSTGVRGGLERESLERYPSVMENLQNRGVPCHDP